MFKRREKETLGRIDTLIGRSASVQGDVEFAGGLHIDGRITGSVRATTGAAASLSVVLLLIALLILFGLRRWGNRGAA